jgi:predicted CopG family antitoxin
VSAKTVALDPEAYDMLRRHRRAGETFSDAVRRLNGRRRSILEFAGIWKDVSPADLVKLREYLAKGRQRDRERMNGLLRAR